MTSQKDIEDAVNSLRVSLTEANPGIRPKLDRWNSNGSVIVGNDITSNEHYVTRYRVDADSPTDVAKDGTSMKVCIWCVCTKKKPCHILFWDFLRGETFLVSLHLLVVALGVVKAAETFGRGANDANIAHSVLETIFVALSVCIRMVSCRMDYVHLTSKMNVNSAVRTTVITTMERYVRIFLIISGILLVFDIAAVLLVLLMKNCNLAWTILTNNFVLIIVNGMDRHVHVRFSKLSNRMQHHQHKAIMYESLLLLTECVQATDRENQTSAYARTAHFCQALQNTDFLLVPNESDKALIQDAPNNQLLSARA